VAPADRPHLSLVAIATAGWYRRTAVILLVVLGSGANYRINFSVWSVLTPKLLAAIALLGAIALLPAVLKRLRR
jgi:hypothetical protein